MLSAAGNRGWTRLKREEAMIFNQKSMNEEGDLSEEPLEVLHLEDSPFDREIIAAALQRGGLCCEITYAKNELEFETAIHRDRFDLVLCDYHLPGYIGTAALATTRRVQPDVPVILISGALSESEAVECLQLGACDYLIKRRLSRLAPAVRRALKEAEEQRARRQAEEALKLSEERFRRLVENSLDLICETSPSGELLYVSPNFRTTLGYPPGDLVGRNILEFIHEDDRRLVKASLAQREVRMDFRWRHREQSFRWIEMTGSVVDTATGEIRVGLTGRDITERRLLEEQLRQAQKLESIGQLASGVAHDFNNILTIIGGHTALLLDEEELSAKARGGLKEVLATANRATNLTRQLLAISRRQVMRLEPLDLSPVVADISQMLHRTLGPEIALHVESDEDLPLIFADAGMMEQILLNLAINARDAMPYGGELTIVTRRAERSTGDAMRGGVELTVSDTGSGIPAHVMPRIFEAFFTTKDVNKGTGLGLATVQSIVNDHQGTIAVASEAGQGTTFTLFFPETQLAAPAAGFLSAEEEAGSCSGTVLVVDDEPAVRTLMEAILETSGCEVLSAGSGKQAIEIFERRGHAIDLLLTDISMPEGVTGEQLAAHLREFTPQLRVIYSSGHRVDDLGEEGTLEEGIGFLPKPFSPSQLLAAVRRSLSRE